MRVEDVMTTKVVTARPETPLKEVARLLVEHGISGIPVVGPLDVVLGVVSEGDILLKEEGLAPEPRGPLASLLRDGDEPEPAKVAARTAGEAMTEPAVTIGPGRRLTEAAKLMVEQKVNRLPVVKDERLVGIVTRADLVRAFARSDDEIAREIREDVLQRTLWLDPAKVAVGVENGHVHISGQLDTKTEAALVGAFARRVPGVVDIDSSELGWLEDDLARRRTLPRLPRRI